jgi:IMP dehydrogenase
MVRVQDVMTLRVETVGPEVPAEEGWQRMQIEGMHHLVVARAGKVVGLFSDRDAGSRRGVALRRGRTVGELMTAKPLTVLPDTPVRKAANLMRGRSIGSLVVTDRSGRLVGIVTVSDLLELLGRGIEHPVPKAVRRDLSHRAPHRKRHREAGVW